MKKIIYIIMLMILIVSVSSYVSLVSTTSLSSDTCVDMCLNLESVIDSGDIYLNMSGESADYNVSVRVGRIFYFNGGDMLD